MSKIIFVNPPYERIAPGYDFVRHITNRSPSLGLLHLAAQVRKDGYQTSIIESDIEGLSVDQVTERIVREKPDYLGLTLFTVAVWRAYEIAKKVKRLLPNVRIIVGGPHLSSMGKETMQRFSEFDIAVLHEGELVLSEMLPLLDTDDDLSNVKGIIYRADERLVTTAKGPIVNDLDALPMPAWNLLPNFPNAYLPAIYDYPRGPVATISASRGCPFLCKFCDTSTFGARVRAYSPIAVFNMMKHLGETYGIRHIMFVDDLFLASRVRTMALCDLLIDSHLDMTWSCAARVDTVKPDVLQRMKQAGCWEISFGLETGSNELLQKMEKAAQVEKSEQAINWTHQAKIRSKGLFMLGYPGETKETIEMTKRFVRRLPMATMNLTKFTPYPGSPVYREIYGTNIRDDHWQHMNGMNFVWAPEGLSVEELDREYQDVLTSFYRQRSVMTKYTLTSLRYPTHVLRLARFALGFAVAKLASYVSGRKGLLIKPDEQNLSDGLAEERAS